MGISRTRRCAPGSDLLAQAPDELSFPARGIDNCNEGAYLSRFTLAGPRFEPRLEILDGAAIGGDRKVYAIGIAHRIEDLGLRETQPTIHGVVAGKVNPASCAARRKRPVPRRCVDPDRCCPICQRAAHIGVKIVGQKRAAKQRPAETSAC